MYKFVLALGATLAAGPALANGLAFEPVAPEGLDATAMAVAEKFQANLPTQMAAFDAAGFGAWGAISVPVGVELGPQSLSAVNNLADRETARTEGLTACAEQFGTECTVIGYMVPEN